ncbi:Neuroligin-4, X-linked [Fusarium oxysporum f. sp. albedinis]|nr:Neuroligin-4, X-linked [Fusarium oxysporum f. sp. albedinis]
MTGIPICLNTLQSGYEYHFKVPDLQGDMWVNPTVVPCRSLLAMGDSLERPMHNGIVLRVKMTTATKNLDQVIHPTFYRQGPMIIEASESSLYVDHEDTRATETSVELATKGAADSTPILTEVKNIYTGLVMLERECTEIKKGEFSSHESNPDLSSKQWNALMASHSTLLHEHQSISGCSSSLCPELRHFRKLAIDHSLHSRTLRRFSDRLLPLLRREQDLESASQWLQIMKLSSLLVDILNKGESLSDLEEVSLLDMISQIEAILERLKLWFRQKYEELSAKKDATGEQNTAEPIFEFPNNIRHLCTTMPWTIMPVLAVLWGVCWMFIIGPGSLELEKLNALVPTLSPVASYHDLYDGSDANYEDALQGFLMQDLCDTVHPPAINDPVYYDIGKMDNQIGPLYSAQIAPQDPDFLALNALQRANAEDVEWSGKEPGDLTDTRPAVVIPDPALQTYGGADCPRAFEPAANVALVGRGNKDDGQNLKARCACPECQQTFATSFTLSRHQTESHKDASSSPEESFPCPNTGCKRSDGRLPFKRLYNLKRHLEVCKHSQNVLSSSAQLEGTKDQSCLQPSSIPALAHEQQPTEPQSEEAIEESSGRKRPRQESDNNSSDESLLRKMKKKRKRMAQEVKEKEDAYLQAREGLDSFDKSIQVLEDSLRKP